MRYTAASIIDLLAWLVLSFALTAAFYKAKRIKTKKMALLIWLLIFLAPGLTYFGAALLKSLR